MAKRPLGDVVVLLPGILGSVLARDGEEVWAPSPGAIGRALWSLGRNVRSPETGADPVDADDLGDGVVATRLMPDIHILPGLWGIDGYSGITKVMLERFDLVAGETYLELPYDYRVQVAAVGECEGLVHPVHGLVCVVSDVEPGEAAP